jgi:Uma2 family endonuclease
MGEPAQQTEFPRFCTLDEYWPLAESSVEKLEFRGFRSFPRRGEIVCMPGGTEYHGLIIANVGGEIRHRMRGKPCRFYSSEFRIGVHGYPTYTYSDGFVICGSTVFDDRDPGGKTAVNPRLIVEVLSPTTEAYDRGAKFKRYMDAESLQEYVIVSQEEPRVEVFFRQPGGTWLLTPYSGTDAVATLRSIEVELPLAEVYLNVKFPAETIEPAETAADESAAGSSAPASR